MCLEIKSRYYQLYVKNLQLRTSAFYLLRTSADFIRKNHPHFTRFNIHRSTRPHFTIGRKTLTRQRWI